MQLIFGEGKVAVSSGRRLEDNVLILEEGLGIGKIGDSVPARPEGMLLHMPKNGIVLAFKNAASVQVVIEELTKLKGYFDTSLPEEDRARLTLEQAKIH